MLVKIVTFLVMIIFLFPSEPRAEEPCVIRSSQDILRCALDRHPDALQSQASFERDASLKKIARQRPNPELNSKIITGDTIGGQVFNTETTLLHTWELGGKRRSRIFQAQAQEQLSTASFLQMKETIALQTVLASNRLRQIRTEKKSIQENRQTYDRILAHYRSRGLLSPEQQVAQNVFESGKQELQFKEASLLKEQTILITFLETATGLPFNQIDPYLPDPKKKWPVFISTISEGQPASVKEAIAKLELAKAGKMLAQSEAWPNLKIGPTVETERLAGNDTLFAGGNIQIPLPIFNRNRGQKTYAKLEEQRAHIHLTSVQEKTVKERENQLQHYSASIKVLGSFKHTINTHQAHKDSEDLFERGLLPISLMIESHRQQFELAEMKHAHELTALEALWKILIIDGRMMEGEL